MKKIITAASLAGFVAMPGSALGQAATSDVVGYETLSIEPGFNFIGLRLHSAPVASGTIETVTANSVTDNEIDLGALMDGSTFILEIEDGSGIIQEVTSSNTAGNGLTIAANLTGLALPVNYTLRPSATLASTFGNSATDISIDAGNGSTVNADQVWLSNGADFDRYYFDSGLLDPATFLTQETWANATTGEVVDGNSIDLVYADGIVLVSATGTDVVIAGDLKSENTELNISSGFNFVSSVAPVGTNLSTLFGNTAAAVSLAQGAGSTIGADQVWIFDGTDFNRFYFDNGFLDPLTFLTQETWANADTGVAVDGSTIATPSGYIIVSTGANDITQSTPNFFDGL